MKLTKVMNNMYRLTSEANKLRVYFSYETPIAFALGDELVIRENDWSNTTGKHLNYVDTDKSKRIDGDAFMEALFQAQLMAK